MTTLSSIFHHSNINYYFMSAKATNFLLLPDPKTIEGESTVDLSTCIAVVSFRAIVNIWWKPKAGTNVHFHPFPDICMWLTQSTHVCLHTNAYWAPLGLGWKYLSRCQQANQFQQNDYLHVCDLVRGYWKVKFLYLTKMKVKVMKDVFCCRLSFLCITETCLNTKCIYFWVYYLQTGQKFCVLSTKFPFSCYIQDENNKC